MTYSRPVIDLMKERFSCRSYAREPIGPEKRQALREAAEGVAAGPLGTSLRFSLVAVEPDDMTALKGLGTYGAIRDPAGFLVGAASSGARYLEDYGYALESLVLKCTDLGLGSCWLGGFFTRGTFSTRIEPKGGERIPAVASVGEIVDHEVAREGFLRRAVGGSRRLSWDRIFFESDLRSPLDRGSVGRYETALEMTRLAPSASNKQPWRVARDGDRWNFYLSRTPGYGGGLPARLLKLEDMQRVDIGIAMCHFEMALRAQGVSGRWETQPPSVTLTDPRTEYVVTWTSRRS